MSSRVFLKNLPISLQDSELIKILSYYGDLEGAYSIKNNQGTSQGYGFADFKNSNTAKRVSTLKMIKIHDQIVEVALYSDTKNKTSNKNFDNQQNKSQRDNGLNSAAINNGRNYSNKSIYNDKKNYLPNKRSKQQQKVKTREEQLYSSK
jgi:RNA recognition motif-containing protein